MVVFTQLLHVSVLVADLPTALAFYQGVLGLTPNSQRPALGYPGAWLDLNPTQQIHLLQLPNPDPVHGRPAHGGQDRHFALAVTDLQTLQQALESAGVAYTLSQSGRRALFCRDPDGNAIECLEIRPC